MTEENRQFPKPREEHNKNNHCFSTPVPPRDTSKGSFDPEEADGYFKLFLGTKKADYDRISGLISVWLELNFVKNSTNPNPSKIQALESKYSEYVKEFFPELSDEQASKFAQDYFDFSSRFVEAEYFRSPLAKDPRLTNVSQINDSTVSPDINGLPPSMMKKLSMREMMRRDYRRHGNEPENFDILLRNSFVLIRVKRPDILELGRIIENIQSEVKGYVRRINANSLTLARNAVSRQIWRYIANNIVWASVKDTDDWYDLANVILLSDMPTICVELMAACSSRGVNIALECVQEKCNWLKYDLVDPTLLTHFVPEFLTEEQSIALGNLSNMVKTYSREEVKKLQKMSSFDLDDRIYYNNGTQYITLAPPTLATSFETFDMFVERIRPDIQALRSNNVNEKDYQQALTALISSVGGSEYVHWVSKMTTIAEPGSGDEDTVYLRDTDSREFNEGLFDIMNDSEELSVALVNKVRRIAPQMSHTIIGVPNYSCEKCRKNTGESDHTIHGITPFDPMMGFFTQAQLLIMARIVKLGDPEEVPSS